VKNQSQAALSSLFPLGCLSFVELILDITFPAEVSQVFWGISDVKRNENKDTGHTPKEHTNLCLKVAS